MAARHDQNYPSSVVSISRVVPVHPKLLQPQRVLDLSNLDRQCPLLMYLVFFYNPSDQKLKDLSLNSVFTSLKSGLEETLTVWYPAAGRLRPNQSDGKLNLWCNNHGAILVGAETPVKISQLGDLSQYSEFFEKLVHRPAFDGNFSNMPLIVAQVTKFGCGGYSIGIGTSHSLFDGPATYDFLRAWASNAEIVKGRRSTELPKPVHERGMLLSDNCQAPRGTINLPSDSSSSNYQQQTRKAMAIDHLYQLIMQAASGQMGFSLQIGPSDQKKCVLKTYHLTGAMIEHLKRKNFPQWRGSLPFSTFEVLAAHLWKARTKALRLRKEKLVCLQFAVDTRNKMVPPLPKGFSGNAYVLASVMMSVGELEEASHEGIIEKVREAKNAVNHDYVKAYVDALQEGPEGSLPPLKELTLVSDWTRMPFHNIDFFNAKAAYACPLATPIPQVAYFMQSPIDNGAVDVRIGFEAETVSAFADCFLSIGQ